MKKYKSKIKSVLMSIAGLLPFTLLRRWASRNPVIINYHSILGWDPDPVINQNIYRTSKQLKADIQFYKKHFNIISVSDLLHHKDLPHNSLVITIDDGLKSVYEVMYPVFKEEGIQATLFINPYFVDNKDIHFLRKRNLILSTIISNDEVLNLEFKDWLSNKKISLDEMVDRLHYLSYADKTVLEELIQLLHLQDELFDENQLVYMTKAELEIIRQDGFCIGAHSMDHPPFGDLSVAEQDLQVKNSIKWVVKEFGLSYRYFAFPSNDSIISREVFESIESEVDLTFGVQGLLSDEFKTHYHRLEVESTGKTASQVLKYEYCKYISKKLFGQSTFKRNYTS